jgi:hypothetical protein
MYHSKLTQSQIDNVAMFEPEMGQHQDDNVPLYQPQYAQQQDINMGPLFLQQPVQLQALVPVLPPRASRKRPGPNDAILPYGFDLNPAARATFIPIMPQKSTKASLAPGEKVANRWANEHREHFYALLEEALTQVNRPLEMYDIRVITEALNRKFRGKQFVDEKGDTRVYQEKGWNAMQSYFLRVAMARYEEIEARVLGNGN